MGAQSAAVSLLATVSLAVGSMSAVVALQSADTAAPGIGTGGSSSCQTQGLTVTDWNVGLTAGVPTVDGATVADISPACAGKQVVVTFTDAEGATRGGTRFIATGGTQTFAFAPVAVDVMHSATVAIEG